MIKQLALVGILGGALASGVAFAAATQEKPSKPARRASAQAAKGNEKNGHTAPNAQPETAAAPSVPTGEMALGTVRLPKPVKADGKSLPPGTYQVKLTAQAATPPATGQTSALERWVEFVQKGQVKGREVVTIVPQAEIDNVQKDAPPPANGAKVEMLKGGGYYRVWIKKGGNHFLIHLPPAA